MTTVSGSVEATGISVEYRADFPFPSLNEPTQTLEIMKYKSWVMVTFIMFGKGKRTVVLNEFVVIDLMLHAFD